MCSKSITINQRENTMSNKVWTTIVMREDNLKVFGLSFPNKFDYPEFYALEKNKKNPKKKRCNGNKCWMLE